jgi:hypothetical protein
MLAVELSRRYLIDVVPEAYFLAPSVSANAESPGRVEWSSYPRIATWGIDERTARSVARSTVSESFAELRRLIGIDPDHRWTEHSPHNLRFVDALRNEFPGAMFVHLVRDGRATAASLRKTDFGPVTATALARWWVESVAVGLAAETRFPQSVVRVRYEDLLTDPEPTLDRVAERCGLTPRDAELAIDPSLAAVSTYTASHHQLVKGNLDSRRISAWSDEMSDGWIRRFEAVAQPVLLALGYDLMHPRGTGTSHPIVRTIDPAVDSLLQLLTRVPRRRRRTRDAVRRAHDG